MLSFLLSQRDMQSGIKMQDEYRTYSLPTKGFVVDRRAQRQRSSDRHSDVVWTTYCVKVQYRVPLDALQDGVMEISIGVDRQVYYHDNTVDLVYLPNKPKSAVRESWVRADLGATTNKRTASALLVLTSVVVAVVVLLCQNWAVTTWDIRAMRFHAAVLLAALVVICCLPKGSDIGMHRASFVAIIPKETVYEPEVSPIPPEGSHDFHNTNDPNVLHFVDGM